MAVESASWRRLGWPHRCTAGHAEYAAVALLCGPVGGGGGCRAQARGRLEPQVAGSAAALDDEFGRAVLQSGCR